MSRAVTLEQLRAELVAAGESYKGGDLGAQREAVMDALRAVLLFLDAEGFSADSLSPLGRPMRALSNVENNSEDALFAKPRQGGRPSTTIGGHERAGILAALANFWLLAHQGEELSVPDQLREAARQMKGRWFPDISYARLKAARDTVSQEGNDHIAVQYAKFASDWLRTFEPGREFGSVIDFLNERGLPFGIGEPQS